MRWVVVVCVGDSGNSGSDGTRVDMIGCMSRNGDNDCDKWIWVYYR